MEQVIQTTLGTAHKPRRLDGQGLVSSIVKEETLTVMQLSPLLLGLQA